MVTRHTFNPGRGRGRGVSIKFTNARIGTLSTLYPHPLCELIRSVGGSPCSPQGRGGGSEESGGCSHMTALYDKSYV